MTGRECSTSPCSDGRMLTCAYVVSGLSSSLSRSSSPRTQLMRFAADTPVVDEVIVTPVMFNGQVEALDDGIGVVVIPKVKPVELVFVIENWPRYDVPSFVPAVPAIVTWSP